MNTNSGNINKSDKISKRFALANKFLLLLIIILGVSYVVGVNDLSIKGFVLKELKVSRDVLNSENTDMELKITDLESYENISNRADELKMVKVDKIDYITVFDESFARK